DVGSGSGYISGDGTFRFWQQDAPLGSPINLNSLPPPPSSTTAYAAGATYAFRDASAVGGDNRSVLKIQYGANVPANGFLDWYEIHFGRKLVAENNAIAFDAPSGSGVARYRVTGFTNDDLIGFDVTDPANPVQLERKQTGESGTFVFHDVLGTARESHRYFITTRGDVKRVATATK